MVEKTFRLADKLGVKTVVVMSGGPGGGPGDAVPNWITHVILPKREAALDYQWNGVLIAYWQKAVALAKDCGIKVAIESLGATMIHNPAKRSWNYVALGHGHDVQWWKELFAVAGYDGPVSPDMEGMNMEPLTKVKKSLETLKLKLPRGFG